MVFECYLNGFWTRQCANTRLASFQPKCASLQQTCATFGHAAHTYNFVNARCGMQRGKITAANKGQRPAWQHPTTPRATGEQGAGWRGGSREQRRCWRRIANTACESGAQRAHLGTSRRCATLQAASSHAARQERDAREARYVAWRAAR